jgi:hypothetical protein
MSSEKTLNLARAAARDLLDLLEACKEQAWATGVNRQEVNSLCLWLMARLSDVVANTPKPPESNGKVW